MQEVNGNLITLAQEGAFDLIAHGCNCQGNMGKGIAKQIQETFPLAAKIDQKGAIPGTIRAVLLESGLSIVNAYTQIYWGKSNQKHFSKSPVNDFAEELVDNQENRYLFIQACFQKINHHFKAKKLGLPLIGCGLAGGDWEMVRHLVIDHLPDLDVTVVHFTPQ